LPQPLDIAREYLQRRLQAMDEITGPSAGFFNVRFTRREESVYLGCDLLLSTGADATSRQSRRRYRSQITEATTGLNDSRIRASYEAV